MGFFRKINYVLAVSAITLSGFASVGYSATIYADSAAYSDVSAAIDKAKARDTVVVPAGSATWTTQLLITKGINLIGAGKDKTIIINGISSDTYVIRYRPSDYDSNDPFRLSGFTFDSNGRYGLALGEGKTGSIVRQTKVRVDHNKFINSGENKPGQAIFNFGSLYGVVDNNIFDGVDYPIRHHSGTPIDTWWETSPQNIFKHGSANYMYFEDNLFDNMGPYGKSDNTLTNGQYSMRYVFRYNTIVTTVPSYSLFDLHGVQDGGNMDAMFGAELYGNHVIAGKNTITLLKQRSGQTLVFNNSIDTSGNASNAAYTSSACDCPKKKAALKVTHNSYWWGSRKNRNGDLLRATASGGLNCAGLLDIPKLGRDIFSDNSSPGVTSGTIENLPSTCSVGAGYWATDQSYSDLTNQVGVNPKEPISGTLYKCTAKNTWTAYYTPYTYPHPLRTGLQLLQPPQGLKIVVGYIE